MQMIEFRKEFRHLIAFRHVPCDLFAAGVVIDMTVGIDDLHWLFPRRSPNCFDWIVTSMTNMRRHRASSDCSDCALARRFCIHHPKLECVKTTFSGSS
jgi:hypothetical protein